MENTGRIEIVIGCMWSGKSTELIRQAKRYSNINKNIMIINHRSDNRYGENQVATHDQNKITCISINNLLEIRSFKEYSKTDIILIDESQFFSDLFDFTIKSADIDNKTIIIFGLDGDFEKNPFGDILRLIPHSEKVTKLNAFCQICQNGTLASFTKRITNSKETHLVGSEDIYQAVCRKHYNVNNITCNTECNIQCAEF